MKTRELPSSFTIGRASRFPSVRARQAFNNKSLQRKNVWRQRWRDERNIINEGFRQIREAEDQLFMELLRKQV